MRIIFRCLLLFLVISLIAMLGLSITMGLSDVVDIIGRTCSDLGIKLDAENIITPTVFVAIQIFFGVAALALTYFTFTKFNRLYHYFTRFFIYFYQAIKGVCADVFTKEGLAILSIPFAASIYFGLTVPVSYDEVWTYVTFTNKPFYYCMVYYPFPNNHVLHSLLTNVTEHLPFFDMLFRIRIPSILLALSAWSIAYSFLKKYYSDKVAMFVVAISAVLFRDIYYSFLSRGYILVVLFFVIALYAAYNIIHKGNRKKDWMFFAISGILGCYAVPSFLYPFATLNLLILIYNYRNLKSQIVWNVVTGFFILVAYTPIFLVSGFKSLADNKFVTMEQRTRLDVLTEMPTFFFEMLENLTGLPSVAILIALGVALIWCVKNRDKQTLVLWAVFVLSPFLLLFLHRVIPFHRTFIYCGFAMTLLFGLSFRSEIESMPKFGLIIALVIMQIGGIFNFKLNIAKDEGFNTYANDVTARILQPNKTYLVNYPHIMFDMEVGGYDLNNLKVEEGPDIKWTNVDTINNIDYVVIYKLFDKTVHKKPFYSNQDLNVYKND